MSVTTTQNNLANVAELTEARANFVGLVRGELRKIAGLRIFWWLAALMALAVIFSQILLATGPNTGRQLSEAPLNAFANAASGDFAIVRILSGIVALVLAAHVVGLEYQQGTIRILLGRGVGRLQLLTAKSLALLVVILAFMLALLAIEFAFIWGITVAQAGGTQPWRALTGEFWADIAWFALCLLINAVVTLLLGIVASVLGRSLAIGLAVGIGFFAVDNLAIIVLGLLANVMHNMLWANLTGLLLGPLLNRLPDYLLPPYHVHSVAQSMTGFGPLPLIWVGAPNALLNIGLWSLLFIATTVTLTVRRDVLD